MKKRIMLVLMSMMMLFTMTSPAVAEGEIGGGEQTAPTGETFDEPAAEQDQVVETTPAEEEAAVEEAPAAVEYPAVDFGQITVGTLTVSVKAPEGAFPAGTQIAVNPVSDAAVEEKAKEAVAGDAKVVALVDISFSYNGEEIEPATPIEVTFASGEIAADTDYSVVHIDDNMVAEKLDLNKVENDGNTVTITNDEFSIYAVLDEGETGDNARLFVTFKQANNGADIVIPVKKSDINTETIDGVEVDHFKQVLYDPGVGTLNGRQSFFGWWKSDTFTIADTENGLDIDEIRDEVETMLNAGVAEGDTITYYPMIFDVYNVTYLDEDGAVIKSVPLLVKNGSSISYQIDEDYDPKDTDSRFIGWGVASQNEEDKWVLPEPVDEDALYHKGDTLTFGTTSGAINDDLVIKAYVPKGFWLIYKENGQGASYTAPQFYRGTPTYAPETNPTRYGYTFGGWYTTPECTTAFTFGNVLEETTRVYAKWNPVAQAPYTVIIWTENINCDGYDFKEYRTVNNATVGQNTNVAMVGTGDNATLRINGNVNVSYTGFHLKEDPADVVVVPEGTTVVNAYFDRTEYTFTFRANAQHRFNQPSGGQSRSSDPLTTIHTVTAKYDQDISGIWAFTGSDGYTYPETNANTSWQPEGSSTYQARITAMERMPAENLTFVLIHTSNTTRTFHYYVEVPEGQTGTRTFQGRQFTLYLDLPNDFNYVYYNDDFWSLRGFNRLAIAKSNNDVVINAPANPSQAVNWAMGWDSNQNNVGTAGRNTLNGSYGGTNNQLYFYYTRQQFPITYWDGKYVDGNGIEITEGVTARQLIHQSADIDFDASIASYGKGGTNYYDANDKIPQGFVFGGWYIDKSCTQEYVFDTMPMDGIKVYAKWVLKQYRVFLYPNATSKNQTGQGTNDPSFESGEQSTSFRIDFDEGVTKPTVIRDEYEINGWYTTPNFAPGTAFSFDSFTANDTTVPTAYDKTEPTEKTYYGDPTSTENKDAAENRYWIDRKLELYAKWRFKLIGTDGITVEYLATDEGQFADGSDTFTDPLRYQDTAMAVAQGASTAKADDMEFKQWRLYEWNGDDFVPTDTTVLPGKTFEISALQARITDDETGNVVTKDQLDAEKSYTYLIRLVAEYGSIEAPTPTFMKWYSNVQDIGGLAIDPDTCTHAADAVDTESDYAERGWVIERSPISINIGYDIEPADTYAYQNYKFIGWAKKKDATPEELFLKWDEETGKFYAQKVEGTGDWTEAVTQVAADENQPYDDLYAIWAGEFYIYHSGVEGGNIETVQITKNVYDLTLTDDGKASRITEGYLYGGYYLEGGFTAPAAVDEKIPAYDGDNWKWTEAQTASAKSITPVVGTTYYLKEVPADKFLQPYLHYTYKKSNNKVQDSYLISDVDDLMYKETGFVVTSDQKAKVCKSLTVKNKVGGASVKLTPAKIFAGKAPANDYLTYVVATSLMSSGMTVDYYWITMDGLRVTGAVERKITYTSFTKGNITATDTAVVSTITVAE